MSIPLTRRIAQAALLVAAGAAPLVGAAGSASAADLQDTVGLGGLSPVSDLDVADTLSAAGETAEGLVRETDSRALSALVGETARTTGPSVHAAGRTVDSVDGTVRSADSVDGTLRSTEETARDAGRNLRTAGHRTTPAAHRLLAGNTHSTAGSARSMLADTPVGENRIGLGVSDREGLSQHLVDGDVARQVPLDEVGGTTSGLYRSVPQGAVGDLLGKLTGGQSPLGGTLG